MTSTRWRVARKRCAKHSARKPARSNRSPDRDRHASVAAARSQPYYLDVTHPDANKGGVVLTLARMLNLKPEEIATIGDMANDVPMFEKGGLSIAMGQASDDVKKSAREVTTSCEDEGFANAIEKFILKA